MPTAPAQPSPALIPVAQIDAYIAAFPAEVQARLQTVRQIIATQAPDAVEVMAYGIPTFDLAGVHLAHYAGYARHIGFYPIPRTLLAFSAQLAGYKSGKGSVQLPLEQPLPVALLAEMVQFRVAEVRAKVAGKGRRERNSAG